MVRYGLLEVCFECMVPDRPSSQRVLDKRAKGRDWMAKRIFIVDDEKCIADALAVILRNSGYQTTAFYDARSALREVESSSPELVVSDVVMPGMSGVDIGVLIREYHPAARFC